MADGYPEDSWRESDCPEDGWSGCPKDKLTDFGCLD